MAATTDAGQSQTMHASAAQTGLFLMVNTFETGGSERQCALLSQHIDAAKFNIHVGCVNPRGPLASQFPKYEQFPVGGSLLSLTSLRSRLDLARHLRRQNVQVAHAFDFYTNLLMIPAARLARTPVVIGSHRQLGDLLTPAQFRAQNAAFRWCDAVVCNSQAGADCLAAAGIPREKLVVVGNAMPDEVFQPAEPALPRDADRPGATSHGVLRVTMIARMNAHYKNHAGFIRIAAEVNNRMPDIEFLLAGDGPLRAEMEQQTAALGLTDRVKFLGDRRDIPAILASTDVSLLTSESEGLSNVILESFAAGVPVVAYNTGGNPELIKPSTRVGATSGNPEVANVGTVHDLERGVAMNDDAPGILIPLGNESEFAAAVCRLLADPDLRHRQGANARRFAERNFSLARVCRQYEDLYMNLLAHKG